MNTIYLPDVVGGGYREFWHCRKRYRVVKGGRDPRNPVRRRCGTSII